MEDENHCKYKNNRIKIVYKCITTRVASKVRYEFENGKQILTAE